MITGKNNYDYKYYSFFISKHRAIQEKSEKEKKISYINPSFLKLIFSYHSKSLIENQIPLNTF